MSCSHFSGNLKNKKKIAHKLKVCAKRIHKCNYAPISCTIALRNPHKFQQDMRSSPLETLKRAGQTTQLYVQHPLIRFVGVLAQPACICSISPWKRSVTHLCADFESQHPALCTLYSRRTKNLCTKFQDRQGDTAYYYMLYSFGLVSRFGCVTRYFWMCDFV